VARQEGVPEILEMKTARPAGAIDASAAGLTPRQRDILDYESTITTRMEAVAGEPVDVVLLKQERLALPHDHPLADAKRGDDAVIREVELRGRTSGRLLIHAHALLLPARIGEDETRQIMDGTAGIGRVLARSGLPTTRDVLWTGVEQGGPNLPSALAKGCLARVYQILVGGRPAILIIERFPRDI